LGEKILVFAPHPDDETLGCGGTIAKRISEGYEVVIVEITDGRYLFKTVLGTESNPTPAEVKQMRKEEVIKATGILGVPKDNLVFFEFEDGKLEQNEKEAKDKVEKILKTITPIEVYFPYAKDFHPDHRSTNRVVVNCLQRTEMHIQQYQYSIMQTSRIGPILDRLLNPIRKSMIDIDISKFLNLKRQAVNEFKSEVSIIAKGQTRPLLRNVENYLRNTESFYVKT